MATQSAYIFSSKYHTKFLQPINFLNITRKKGFSLQRMKLQHSKMHCFLMGAHLHLGGTLNKQNVSFRARKYPQSFTERWCYRRIVTVWIAISSLGLTVPIHFILSNICIQLCCGLTLYPNVWHINCLSELSDLYRIVACHTLLHIMSCWIF
jgi:hypothetical protein